MPRTTDCFQIAGLPSNLPPIGPFPNDPELADAWTRIYYDVDFSQIPRFHMDFVVTPPHMRSSDWAILAESVGIPEAELRAQWEEVLTGGRPSRLPIVPLRRVVYRNTIDPLPLPG